MMRETMVSDIYDKLTSQRALNRLLVLQGIWKQIEFAAGISAEDVSKLKPTFEKLILGDENMTAGDIQRLLSDCMMDEVSRKLINKLLEFYI